MHLMRMCVCVYKFISRLSGSNLKSTTNLIKCEIFQCFQAVKYMHTCMYIIYIIQYRNMLNSSLSEERASMLNLSHYNRSQHLLLPVFWYQETCVPSFINIIYLNFYSSYSLHRRKDGRPDRQSLGFQLVLSSRSFIYIKPYN